MNFEEVPDTFQAIPTEYPLTFACHPNVPCFTECCRELDLALTPYDVLRLKRHLGVTSEQFLQHYMIVEWDESHIFPTCYLTMVDDGRASCVFISQEGCTVYANRPGSCRAYPVGRGAAKGSAETATESLVLLREPHCRGFAETGQQTVRTYLLDQGLAPYNQYNDALLPLLHHATIQNRTFRPSQQHYNQYMLALYDLDQFSRQIVAGRIVLQRPLTPLQLTGLTDNDEELLRLGISWLMQEFFGE